MDAGHAFARIDGVVHYPDLLRSALQQGFACGVERQTFVRIKFGSTTAVFDSSGAGFAYSQEVAKPLRQRLQNPVQLVFLGSAAALQADFSENDVLGQRCFHGIPHANTASTNADDQVGLQPFVSLSGQVLSGCFKVSIDKILYPHGNAMFG